MTEKYEVETILEFAHHLTSKDGIIKEGKFQPVRQKTQIATAPIKLPKKSKRISDEDKKRMGIIEGGIFESNIAPGAIPDEEARNEIKAMGVENFKKLPENTIKNYYKQIKDTNAVPQVKKQELVALILRLLGINK